MSNSNSLNVNQNIIFSEHRTYKLQFVSCEVKRWLTGRALYTAHRSLGINFEENLLKALWTPNFSFILIFNHPSMFPGLYILTWDHLGFILKLQCLISNLVRECGTLLSTCGRFAGRVSEPEGNEFGNFEYHLNNI